MMQDALELVTTHYYLEQAPVHQRSFPVYLYRLIQSATQLPPPHMCVPKSALRLECILQVFHTQSRLSST